MVMTRFARAARECGMGGEESLAASPGKRLFVVGLTVADAELVLLMQELSLNLCCDSKSLSRVGRHKIF